MKECAVVERTHYNYSKHNRQYDYSKVVKVAKVHYYTTVDKFILLTQR